MYNKLILISVSAKNFLAPDAEAICFWIELKMNMQNFIK